MSLPTEHQKSDILEKVRGKKLFHSNSVLNSIQFILNGALLSRNFMVQKRLPITPQLSDLIDIKNRLFDALFLETENEENNLTNYGPIIFHFTDKIIDNPTLNPFGRFLRSNPESWTDDTAKDEKYLPKRETLTNECLIVYHSSGFLPFNNSLEKIEIQGSLQSPQKKREGKRGRSPMPHMNCWSGSEESFEDVAKLNIEGALRQTGYSCPVNIVSRTTPWKSKMTNWLRMMYSAGKIYDYQRELQIIFGKRRFNQSFRGILESEMPKLREFYSIT
jgi:hypothetical protein